MARAASSRSTANSLIAAILVIAALYLARDILVPFAVAVLVSFLLAPLVDLLQRRGAGRVPAIALVLLVGLMGIAGVGWLVLAQGRDVAEKLPTYRGNIVRKIQDLKTSVGGAMSAASETVEDISREIGGKKPKSHSRGGPDGAERLESESTQPPHGVVGPDAGAVDLIDAAEDGQEEEEEEEEDETVRVEVVSSAYGPMELLRMAVGPLLEPLTKFGIGIAFVVFMLHRREDLRDRVIRLAGFRRINMTTRALDDAAARVGRYLLLQLIVNTANGITIGMGLFLIGLPNPLLWGALVALLRFIPFVGTTIAALMPIALSLALFENWTLPLLVVGLFLLVDLISSNLLEPWLYGTHTGASPLAILVSAVFWTWLWGAVGLLMAIPLTVCLVVLGKYVPSLEFLSILLGDQPALGRDIRLYQRILARDRVEVGEIFEEAMGTTTLEELYEQILMPALSRLEIDRDRGVLDEVQIKFANETLRELVEDMGSRRRATDVEKPTEAADRPAALSAPPLLFVPARDEADELGALVLEQLLERDGWSGRTCSEHVLTSELMDELRAEKIALVCIVAVDGTSDVHARYRYLRISRQLSEVHVVILLWGATSAERQTFASSGFDPRVELTTSLPEAHQVISRRLHELSAVPARTPALT